MQCSIIHISLCINVKIAFIIKDVQEQLIVSFIDAMEANEILDNLDKYSYQGDKLYVIYTGEGGKRKQGFDRQREITFYDDVLYGDKLSESPTDIN